MLDVDAFFAELKKMLADAEAEHAAPPAPAKPMAKAPSAVATSSPLSGLFASALSLLWPHGNQHVPGLVPGMIAAAPAVLSKYAVADRLTLAMMMGQFSEECGAGLEVVENMNYSAEGLLKTFPTHFTGSMAARYAHNPRMIADVAYGGRMGNAPPPSDDGWRYIGRGLSQVSGHDGYAKLAAATGLDVLGHPEILSDPAHALECGVADFVLCGCLPFAKTGNLLEVTKHLNGGTNGLAERAAWTARWKRALGVA